MRTTLSSFLRAAFALLPGISACLSDKRLRKLAIRPMIVGALTTAVLFLGALRLHPRVQLSFVSWFTWAPEWFSALLTWSLAWLFLLFVLAFSSVAVVLTFTSYLQTALVARVLEGEGREVPSGGSGLHAAVKEGLQEIVSGILRTICLLPFLLASVILAFIPPLLPFAIMLGAWLLAVQFLDIILEVLRVPVIGRVKFAFTHMPRLIIFGLTLSVLWLIPFAGFLFSSPALVGLTLHLMKEELLPVPGDIAQK